MNSNPVPSITILILAANPQKTTPCRLEKEVREIEAGLKRSKYRDSFILKQRWAVTPHDVRRALLDSEPQIVHFAGYGAGEKGLVLEDRTGQEKFVSCSALAELFGLFANKVKCVLLNACYSEIQAEAIVQFIDTVVGVSTEIKPLTAIDFAVGFYDGLAAGKTIDFAYKLGCNAIHLNEDDQKLAHVLKKKKVSSFTDDLNDSTHLEMISIPGDIFEMGSPDNELQRLEYESPLHPVSIKSFFISKFPITQRQWKAVVSKSHLLEGRDLNITQKLDLEPFHFKDENHPIEQVSWSEAKLFCRLLSRNTGREYRLPTEAEWEYACRAGTTTPFYFGETITSKLANYDGCETYGEESKGEYRRKTTPVGMFPPNAFRIHDMHGNVWEWCEDDWHSNYTNSPNDGTAWISHQQESQFKVIRGGSWRSKPNFCRSAFRNGAEPGDKESYIGFRVVCNSLLPTSVLNH